MRDVEDLQASCITWQYVPITEHNAMLGQRLCMIMNCRLEMINHVYYVDFKRIPFTMLVKPIVTDLHRRIFTPCLSSLWK